MLLLREISMKTSISNTAFRQLVHEITECQRFDDITMHIVDKLIDAANGGMTTRGIADNCDLSIYSARNRLLKLEELKLVKKESEMKGLRWFFNRSLS